MIDAAGETYRTLYGDDSGSTIGIDEVQLLEHRPADRLRALRALLVDDDATVRFHSMLVLVAWGDPDGIDAAWRFLTRDHRTTDIGSGHRLHGRDMSYDELANAFALSLTNPDVVPGDLRLLAERLLTMFRTECFESGLERFLAALADPDLEREVLDAVRDVLTQGRVRQAADLLPALAATNDELAWQGIDLFRTDGGILAGAVSGVAFTLGRIDTAPALDLLRQLGGSGQAGAREAVEMALRLPRRQP